MQPILKQYLIPLLLLTVAIILITVRKAKEKMNKGSIQILEGKSKGKAVEANLYNFLNKLPIISKYLFKIRFKLYITTGVNESELRFKTQSIIIKSFIFTFIGFIAVFYFIDKTLYNIVIALTLSVFFFNNFVNGMVGDDDSVIEQLPEALNDIKHYYASEKTIEKAFACALDNMEHGVEIHIRKIYEQILLKPASVAALNLRKFYQECPDRILRLLAGYSFLTKEYGDAICGSSTIRDKETNKKVVIDGESLFSKNLNFLSSEARNEFRKRRIIKSGLFGQSLFVIIPVFALPMIKYYVEKYVNIPHIVDFYNSSMGYLALIISLAITVMCYLAYNAVAKSNVDYRDYKIAGRAWEDYVLRFPLIRALISRLVPTEGTKRYKKVKRLISRSGILQKLEWFYLKKVISFAVALVAFTLIVLVSKYINIDRIYTKLDYDPNAMYQFHNRIQMEGVDKQLLEQREPLMIDEAAKIKDSDFKDTKEHKELIKKIVLKHNPEFQYKDDLVDETTERIYKKVEDLKGNKILNYDLLIAILLSYLSYFVPNINLLISSYSRRFSMFDEVMSFQTIILLLMNHERVTIDMILDEMIMFADIFYVPLKETKNNFSQGIEKALLELKHNIDYRPLKRIINNLYLAKKNLSITEAFSGLEQDQKFNLDLRKDNTESIAQTKIAIASRIVSVSMYATLFLYLMLPIGYAAAKMMFEINDKINMYWR